MPRRGSRVRIANCVYQDATGISAVVNLRVNGELRSKEARFPLGTDLARIQKWQRRAKARLIVRAPKAKATVETLSTDIDRYLATIADRKARQYAQIQLEPWRTELGTMHRHDVTSVDLKRVLAAWQTPTGTQRRYAANTLNHRLTALRKLYVVLDADDEFAPNPTLKVKKLREPDAEPREIPFAFIQAIFEALPTHSTRRRKLTHDHALRVHEAAQDPTANASAIARRFRISETMVRKLAKRAPEPERDIAAIHYAQLWVRSATGFPPKAVMQLRPEHFDEATATVWLQPRRKGRGAKGDWLPVTPAAVEALKHFFAIGATGPFDTSAHARAWRKAVEAAKAAFKKRRVPLPPLPRNIRPYDLRHSFLTRAWRAAKNRKGVQRLGQHADPRTTDRYTLGAVDEGAKATAEAMASSEPRLAPRVWNASDRP